MKKLIFAASIIVLLFAYQNCTQIGGTFSVSETSSSPAGDKEESEGGHEHGNGGDDTRYAKVAWFPRADRTVRYCVEVAPEFPVSREVALSGMNEALRIWSEFLNQVKNQMYSTSLIARDFELISDCENADLKLRFGGSRTEGSTSSIGVSSRESFDTTTNWGRGEIWLSSQGVDWNESFRLKGALLHLLGDVLGFGSVQGTILDERWEQWLQAPRTAELETRLTRIESERRIGGILRLFQGPVAMTPELKSILGLSTAAETEMAEIHLGNQFFKIQSREYRIVRLFHRVFNRGFSHKVVYFDLYAPYSFMRTIPKHSTQEDTSTVGIIQFLDLPGRPQMIVELNGDQAISLKPLP